MLLDSRRPRPTGPAPAQCSRCGWASQARQRGSVLTLALLAIATPARGQVIGPNVPATSTAGIQNEPQVAASGNTLVAVWYRGELYRFSGWGMSLDGGATWIDGGAFPLADPERHVILGQPTICVDQASRFYAATVYGDTGEGVALYRGTPQGGGLSWEGPIHAIPPTLIPGFDLPRALDAVRLTCDPERQYLYLSYTRSLALADDQYEYTVQFLRSLDGGTTWSMPLVLSSGIASNGSRPAVGPEGGVYVVWEDFASRQVVGRRSADFGTTFGPPFVVGEIRDNLGTRPPDWQEPSWRFNPIMSPVNADLASDFPSLAVDRSNGPYRGRIYATWTDFAEGSLGPRTGLSYDLEPNDWYAVATEVEIGHDISGFVPGVDFGGEDSDLYTFTGTAGTTIQITGRVTNVFPAPDRPLYLIYTLLCGQDTLQLTTASQSSVPLAGLPGPPPTIYTLPADGRYYLRPGVGMRSYWYEFSLRAVSPLAGQAAQDHRDIVLTWSDDGGATWTPKRRVSDAPPRYDESFPAVAVDELGRVHLAWYDRRDDPPVASWPTRIGRSRPTVGRALGPRGGSAPRGVRGISSTRAAIPTSVITWGSRPPAGGCMSSGRTPAERTPTSTRSASTTCRPGSPCRALSPSRPMDTCGLPGRSGTPLGSGGSGSTGPRERAGFSRPSMASHDPAGGPATTRPRTARWRPGAPTGIAWKLCARGPASGKGRS